MKISKFWLVLIIGILCLNLIFAGTYKKNYRISGDLVISPSLERACSSGQSTWTLGVHNPDPCTDNLACGGGTTSAMMAKNLYDKLFFALPVPSCDLEIYSPNSTTTPIFKNVGLNATAIKNGLKNGIVVGPIEPNSTIKTIDFTVKIKHQATGQYLLTTTITVPNPNFHSNVITADYMKSTADTNAAACNIHNLRKVTIKDGTLVQCKQNNQEFLWEQFATNQWVSQMLTSQNDEILIDVQSMLTSEGYITSAEVDTKLSEFRISDIEYTQLSEDTREIIGQVSSDTINPLPQVVSGKYLKIYDTVNQVYYYIPVYQTTDFEFSAWGNLWTKYPDFNRLHERISSQTRPYPPTDENQVFSDFWYSDKNAVYHAQLDRRHLSTQKYRAIDFNITNGGADQNYVFEVKICSGNDPSTEETNVTVNPVWDCAQPINIKDENGEIRTNPFTLRTNSGGRISRRVYVKLTPNKKAAAIYANLSGSQTKKSRQVMEVVNLYEPINNITLSNPSCRYTINQEPNQLAVYNYTVTGTFTSTGGSTSTPTSSNMFFNWCAKAYVWNYASNLSELSVFGCDPHQTDNAQINLISGFSTGNLQLHARVVATIKDNRTGQRFAKSFKVTGCIQSS